MDIASLIQALGNKVGSNLDDSNAMLKQQTALAQKQMQNPQYVPTQDELDNQNKYFSAVNGAVAGSLGGGAGGVNGAANAAKTASNEAFDAAAASPISASPPVLNAVQQAASRGVDMADRYKAQLQAAKQAALAKIRGQ